MYVYILFSRKTTESLAKMGKASKWIVNFLLGKKEYRKRSDTSLSMEFQSIKMESQPGTPKVKRKWSFRRLSGKSGSRKFSLSFDSVEAKVLLHATEGPVIRGHIKNVAATKIQAAFRSYLARKALLALRGLVKLQALVRGHIVRKQTTSTLKQMHALMSIQVRARVQRIHMAKEISNDDGLTRDRRKSVNSFTKIERFNMRLHSDHLSASKSFRSEEQYSSTAESNNPQSYSVTLRPDYPEPLSYGYPLLPNYMINTESSRAKVRSQSEPKQRPKWNTKQKNKQTDSLDDPVTKRSSFHCEFDARGNHNPWFCKLYKTERPSKENNMCESVHGSVGHSKYYESFTD